MKTAYFVAGLAYGDEGKGSIVDYLVRKNQAGLVIRYNGGAQAAHNVITPDGKHHTFAQFGSGTLSGARTHLTKDVLVEPRFLINEADHLESLGLKNPLSLITIDPRALVITPFQIAANRIIEAHRKQDNSQHGTCGMGIGTTREDHLKYGPSVLFADDLKYKEITIDKLRFLQSVSLIKVRKALNINKDDELPNNAEAKKLIDPDLPKFYWEAFYQKFPVMITDKLVLPDCIVFEGAQGLLLDEKFGTAPHNTWTNITFENAYEFIKEQHISVDIEKVGVFRSYFTRHGAGPFPTESKDMHYPERHNTSYGYQGAFRQGDFDFVDAVYAFRAIGGVDTIAVNHLDVVSSTQGKLLVHSLASTLGVDKFILGYGPKATDKKEILLWDGGEKDDSIRGSLCCS